MSMSPRAAKHGSHQKKMTSGIGHPLPIAALGPDVYREVVPAGNQCSLLVRRDENHAGWLVSELPGFQAAITCGNGQMTGSPSWSNFTINGFRYGDVDITQIYDENEDIHVEYTYLGEVYYEDFPA